MAELQLVKKLQADIETRRAGRCRLTTGFTAESDQEDAWGARW